MSEAETETEAEALRCLEKTLELVDTTGPTIVACYLQFSIDQLRSLERFLTGLNHNGIPVAAVF